MGAWYFKQPNGLYGRFSTVVDTVTDWNLTKDELRQDMIDRFGKYDYDVQHFDDFVNQTAFYKGRSYGFYLHDFDDVLHDMTSSNESTESVQEWLEKEMGFTKEEASKYYFMDYPEDTDEDDPIWKTYNGCLQKRD